jgi:hypothetical protein
MNKNYLCIEFNSNLSPGQMLTRLSGAFPKANWHGSDTDTQGPSLSSLQKEGPQVKIFFEERAKILCMNFSNLGLKESELEEYKKNYVSYVREQVLPLITRAPL